MLGFYSANFDKEVIRTVIKDENSPYYYDWRGILSDPDHRYLSIYDFRDTVTGKSYYYFEVIAYSNNGQKRTATLSTGERHDSINECLIDLIENYSFVRL